MNAHQDAARSVKMVNSVDYVVGVGHASGLVNIYQLQSRTVRTNNTV